jgi:hypothetical protein
MQGGHVCVKKIRFKSEVRIQISTEASWRVFFL